jgi:hypothetical protein
MEGSFERSNEIMDFTCGILDAGYSMLMIDAGGWMLSRI